MMPRTPDLKAAPSRRSRFPGSPITGYGKSSGDPQMDVAGDRLRERLEVEGRNYVNRLAKRAGGKSSPKR